MNFRKKLYSAVALFCLASSSIAQITNPLISNDANNIYFSFDESTQFNFYQVYVDTDMNAKTGYSIDGIGADRLIENASTYKYVGPGWNWSFLQNVTFNNTVPLKQWTVPLSVLGLPQQCSTPVNVLFNATNSSGGDMSSVIPYSVVLNQYCNVITSPTASSTDTQFSFSYSVTTAQTFNRVYIDTTGDPNTGFPVGGIGAKYLIENNSLYSYVGPGWNWLFVKTVTMTNTNNNLTWTINRDDIGNMDCAGAIYYADQVQTGETIDTIPKMTLNFGSDTLCGQKIAVPSYFAPCTGTNCSWTQLNSSIPQVGLAVINPDSGPGSSFNSSYLTQTKTTQGLGAYVLGYVYTNYGARPLAQVEADIDSYYNWYNVSGIFFDEGYYNDCSMLGYYQILDAYVKAKGGLGVTVINYGTNTQQCYAVASDILIDFEGDYSTYLTWAPSSWVADYPASLFWQIIYNTAQVDVSNAIALSKQRNAGWVYVTSLTLPNPYSALPTQAYWDVELGAL